MQTNPNEQYLNECIAKGNLNVHIDELPRKVSRNGARRYPQVIGSRGSYLYLTSAVPVSAEVPHG